MQYRSVMKLEKRERKQDYNAKRGHTVHATGCVVIEIRTEKCSTLPTFAGYDEELLLQSASAIDQFR